MYRTRNRGGTWKVAASAAAVAVLAVSGSTGAAAVEPVASSATEIVEDYVGQEAEVLTGEASVGDILTVAPAEETDETLVVDDGERVSVVAVIEEESVDTVSFELDLSSGYRLELTPDGSSGLIFDEVALAEMEAQGARLPTGATLDMAPAVAATLYEPWAVDASGNELKTHYELQGDTLVQHVDVEEAEFPIAADPSLGLGHQGPLPVYYVHYSRGETYDISFYRPSSLASVGWLCDFLPGWAVSPCRSLLNSYASKIVNTAKSARDSGKCLSTWQGVPVGGVISMIHSIYKRTC